MAGDATPEEYLDAADKLVEGLEKSAATNKREVASFRLQLTAAAREASRAALDRMQTIRQGRTRILAPTATNRREAIGASERIRERFSRFSLQWLDKAEVRRLVSQGFTAAQQRDFFRHSNRLARNARTFLNRLGELEPSLEEEIEATISQIDDARNDLTKLEVRSWTKAQENLLRNINGRQTRERARQDVQTFDIDRNLYNLSLLEHPKGVARELLANSTERMAARVTTSRSELPRRALVFVGAGPDAVSKMTPDSRTARVLFRVFSARELDERFAAINKGRTTTSNWRGLGLAYNTPEWYVPIPPEVEDDVRREMRKRRREFLARIRKPQEREE